MGKEFKLISMKQGSWGHMQWWLVSSFLVWTTSH